MKILQNKGLYEALIEQGVKKTRRSLWIATANVKNFRIHGDGKSAAPLPELFLELVDRGAKIRLLHSGIPSGPFRQALKETPALEKSGLFQMRRCPRVHFKAILFDHSRLYLGSANLTGAGMGIRSEKTRNFEMGIVTDDEAAMDAVAERFSRIWEGEECKGCGLYPRQCPAPLEGPYD